MKLALVGVPKRVIRRAVFVCDQPDVGTVVLDRSLFRRRILSNLDECYQGSTSLVETAVGALERVFNTKVRRVVKSRAFRLQGHISTRIECTVFVIIPDTFNGYEKCLKKINPEQLISLDKHPNSHQIEEVLKDLNFSG